MEDPLPCMNVCLFFFFSFSQDANVSLTVVKEKCQEMEKLRVFVVLVCQSLIRPVLKPKEFKPIT